MALTAGVILLVMCLCAEGTDRPIIGILSQELSPSIAERYPDHKCYVAAAYVKAVEASGARVVPIIINQTEEYYQDIMTSVNGLLLPGGNTLFTDEGGYADSAKILIDIAKKMNDEGQHVPVMGICLGMQFLLYNDVGEMRAPCNAKNISLPLQFLPGYKASKLFAPASKGTLRLLKHKNVTFNEHEYCVTEKNFTKFGLNKKWKALSKNKDKEGLEFISTVESVNYPIVGLQFHPEKNPYAWKTTLKLDRTHYGLRATRYFFDWLVFESKLNNHSFTNEESENYDLIYNYKAFFSGEKNLIYEQIYLF